MSIRDRILGATRRAETVTVPEWVGDDGEPVTVTVQRMTARESREWAKERDGIDHAKVGYELAIRWRLPADLCLLIGRHEGPFEGDPVPTLYVVHAADRLATSVVRDGDPRGSDWMAEPPVEAWLKWTEAEREWTYQEAQLRLQSMSELMGVLA